MSTLTEFKKLYDEGHSIKEIAEQHNTYPNKIRRMFIKAGYELRDKSEAQKLALESGRSTHPTEGCERSEETKRKISKHIAESWQNISTAERKRRSKSAQEQWKKMPDHVKENLFKSAARGVAKAGREGSKIEKFLMEKLQNLGYSVIWHKEGLVTNKNLQIDLFLPKYKLAVELDGPTHFLPIYGEEKLIEKQLSDKEKNGLLLKDGYSILRVKSLVKNLSQNHCHIILDFIVDRIEKNTGKKNYYDEIEIS